MIPRDFERLAACSVAAFVATLVSAFWWLNGGGVVICEVTGWPPTDAHLLTLSGPLALLSGVSAFLVVGRVLRDVKP